MSFLAECFFLSHPLLQDPLIFPVQQHKQAESPAFLEAKKAESQVTAATKLTNTDSLLKSSEIQLFYAFLTKGYPMFPTVAALPISVNIKLLFASDAKVAALVMRS